jgi:hypothetical protein
MTGLRPAPGEYHGDLVATMAGVTHAYGACTISIFPTQEEHPSLRSLCVQLLHHPPR